MFGDRNPEVMLISVGSIGGLFEAHSTVSDLEHSIVFHRDTTGLELAHIISSRHVAFFWIGAPDAAMLGPWSIHSSPVFMRLHIAFQVTLQQVEASIGAQGHSIVITSGSAIRKDAVEVHGVTP